MLTEQQKLSNNISTFVSRVIDVLVISNTAFIHTMTNKNVKMENQIFKKYNEGRTYKSLVYHVLTQRIGQLLAFLPECID